MIAPAPEWIGRYRVRDVIGTGAFATVYRATDDHLDVDVALKVLAENHSLDPDVRQRFIEEGRRLRQLRSPHLVPIHDLGDTDRAQPYLVLEWADRGDLGRRVAEAPQQGRLPAPSDVLAVARALAAALRVLHGQGIVHRDLTPGNLLLASITPTRDHTSWPGDGPPPGGDEPGPVASGPGRALIGEDERLMLTDLGLSKDLAAASGLTVAAGTSGFAPPEQQEPGALVDQRADVWAASALVIWLVLQRPPDSDRGWRRDLRSAGWPTAFTGALKKGLADRPDRRQPHIDAWLADLEQALGQPEATGSGPVAAPGPQGGAPGAGAPPALSPGMAQASGRSGAARARLMAVAVAALVTGGAVGAVAAAWGDDGPAAQSDRLDSGDLRTVVEDHGITVELEGPTDTAVGEPVRLSAAVDGARAWQWVGPDGAVHLEQAVIELAPDSAGSATARLFAFDSQGRVVEATHTLHVTENR